MTYTAAQGLGCIGNGDPKPCCTALNTGTCTASFTTTTGIDRIAQGVIDIASAAGGNINLITEKARRFDVRGLIPLFSLDGVTNQAMVLPPGVVTVGATGCMYPTLTAACAAVVSTPSVPLQFWLAPGRHDYSAACSNQDTATIVGGGIGTTVLGPSVSGSGITIGTNTTLRDMTIVSPTLIGVTGSGNGLTRMINLDIQNTTASGSDCIYLTTTTANAQIYLINSRCTNPWDGFTVAASGGANTTSVHSIGNHYAFPAGFSPQVASLGSINMLSLPCNFESVGDTIEMVSTSTTAHSGSDFGYQGYSFGSGLGNHCASPNRYSIRGAKVLINDKTANGTNADTSAVYLGSSSSTLPGVDISGSTFDVNMPNDTGNGTARGIVVIDAAPVVTLNGVRIRTTGGQASTRKDLFGTAPGNIVVGPEDDFLTDNGNITGDRSRNARATAPATCMALDKYADTFPTLCLCIAANTWLDLRTNTSPGNCQ